MNIFFDIDGTIISEDDKLRPHVHHVMMEIIKREHTIYLWTGGGIDYARMNARRHKLEGYIKDYFPKGISLPNNLLPDYVIDDTEFVVDASISNGKTGYKVQFYNPFLMPEDKELLEVLDDIKEKYDKR